MRPITVRSPQWITTPRAVPKKPSANRRALINATIGSLETTQKLPLLPPPPLFSGSDFIHNIQAASETSLIAENWVNFQHVRTTMSLESVKM